MSSFPNSTLGNISMTQNELVDVFLWTSLRRVCCRSGSLGRRLWEDDLRAKSLLGFLEINTLGGRQKKSGLGERRHVAEEYSSTMRKEGVWFLGKSFNLVFTNYKDDIWFFIFFKSSNISQLVCYFLGPLSLQTCLSGNIWKLQRSTKEKYHP